MLISDSHKFLFIHMPKNAGSSVRGALSPLCLQTKKRYPEKLLTKLHLDFDWRRHSFKGHASMRDVEAVLPDEYFSELYTIHPLIFLFYNKH